MDEKVPKSDVDYGPGDVDGPHCGACEHFIEPNHCGKVYGKIRSGGWCRLYHARGATKEEADGDPKEAG